MGVVAGHALQARRTDRNEERSIAKRRAGSKRGRRGGRHARMLASAAKHGVEVPATVDNSKNQNVIVIKTVDDDLIVHGKTPTAGAEFPIPGPNCAWKSRQNAKTLGDLTNGPTSGC
jgi:hypothetical protein